MNMEAFSGCMPNEAIYRMERASGTRISFASNTKQKSQKMMIRIPAAGGKKLHPSGEGFFLCSVLKKYADAPKVIVIGHGMMIEAVTGAPHPKCGEIVPFSL